MKPFLTLLSMLILFSGCGGSSGGTVTQTDSTGGPVGTTSIRIEQNILAQGVPSNIDQVRITGSVSGVVNGVLTVDGGGRPYGPQVFPLAPVYVLENIPVNVDFLSLEYLQGGVVRGLYFEKVQLVAGQTYEIIDPAIAFRPDDITDFKLEASSGPNIGVPPLTGEYDLELRVGSLAEVTLYPVLPDGTEDDLLRRFTVYRSDDPSIVSVTNGGVDFNSSDTSGNLSAHKLGRTTIHAVFFDLERSFDVSVIDFSLDFANFNYNFPLSFEYSVDTSDIDPIIGRFRAFYVSEERASGDVELTEKMDQILWVSESPEVLRFDTTPGREGYIQLSGLTDENVRVWAYYPEFHRWSSTFLRVDQDLIDRLGVTE